MPGRESPEAQDTDLRIHLFPEPAGTPNRQRVVVLVSSTSATQADLTDRTAECFVQCNCACK